MVGGIRAEDAAVLPQQVRKTLEPEEDSRDLRRVTGPPDGEIIWPALTPDLLGEWFVLEALRPVTGAFGEQRAADDDLRNFAWSIRNGFKMPDFVFRAIQNFPNHSATKILAEPFYGKAESRLLNLNLALKAEDDGNFVLDNEWDRVLLASQEGDPGACEAALFFFERRDG